MLKQITMSQQTNMTAVEWLEQEFNDTFYVAQSSEIAKRFERIFEQAKSMEKEQLNKARLDGINLANKGYGK